MAAAAPLGLGSLNTVTVHSTVRLGLLKSSPALALPTPRWSVEDRSRGRRKALGTVFFSEKAKKSASLLWAVILPLSMAVTAGAAAARGGSPRKTRESTRQ